jgi:type IV pilus assembly protein PilW
VSGRGFYNADSARTRLNQSLQATKDFLVTDIRQAGERLPDDVPAIEVLQGADDGPDELILRRNLHDVALLVCEEVAPSAAWITVSLKTGTPPPGCAPLPVDPGETLPTDLQDWSDYRVARGGQVRAYIYDPVLGEGELFDYSDEREEVDAFTLGKATGAPNFERTYTRAAGSRVYLLEERRYRLDAGMLQMIVDDRPSDLVNLVEGIEDFQVLEMWKTGAGPGDAWTRLSGVHVRVDGRVPVGDRTLVRSWSARVMPRNVLAR